MGADQNLNVDDKSIALRHNQHYSLARVDDATNRVHCQLVHHAIMRCAKVDAFQLIFGSHSFLDEFCDFALHLAEFLGHVTSQFLVDLNDLKFSFGNLPVRLCHRGNQLTMLTLQAGRIPFESRDPLNRDEVLAPQFAHPWSSRLMNCVSFSLLAF